MSLHESIQAFRGVQRIAEGVKWSEFEPTSGPRWKPVGPTKFTKDMAGHHNATAETALADGRVLVSRGTRSGIGWGVHHYFHDPKKSEGPVSRPGHPSLSGVQRVQGHESDREFHGSEGHDLVRTAHGHVLRQLKTTKSDGEMELPTLGQKRAVSAGVAESFDPMSDKADFPDVSKLANNYKKASQQSDAIRAQSDESPEAQKALWQSHKAKKDAHAALIGRVVVDFPHLSAEDALHVAGKHVKQGSMQPFEHIGVLSDLWGARDHNEHGVTFNTPARNTRAEGFIKCLKFHHPDIEFEKKDMPTEGLTVVQFPGMEHVPPPEPPAEEAPPEQGAPEEAPPEQTSGQPEAAPEEQAEQTVRPMFKPRPMSAIPGLRSHEELPPAKKPEPPKKYQKGWQPPTATSQTASAQDMFSPQAAAEAFHIKPFRQFTPVQESAETASWAKVKAFKREADELQQRAVAAHLRRDPAKEALYKQASDHYTQMQKAERDHLERFGGRVDRRGK